jgi:hypothetical protein
MWATFLRGRFNLPGRDTQSIMPTFGFLAARKIQVQVLRCIVRRGFIGFLVARKIHAQVRRIPGQRAFIGLIAASKIQAQIRRFLASLHRARSKSKCESTLHTIIKQLAASEHNGAGIGLKVLSVSTRLCVQSKHHQKLREYCSTIAIQSAWRMKRTRIYFLQLRSELMKDEIKGLIQIQKIWRGYTVRAHQGLTIGL